MLEDKLLVWKLKRGNKDALCRIYEKYRDDLLRIAAGLLNDTTAAEDIVHEVFITFVRTANDFELTGSLKGYLATCVANRARNFNRFAKRHSSINLEKIEPMISTYKRPEQWIIQDEQFTLLNNALAELPYEQKEAVVLRIQAGMKFKNIAKLQAASIKTALSRYRYGLTKLRAILNGEVTK